MIPVEITKTAVNEGKPPSSRVIPIATGAVTDLGASDRNDCSEPPNPQAMNTADPAATNDPDNRLTRMAKADRRTLSN